MEVGEKTDSVHDSVRQYQSNVRFPGPAGSGVQPHPGYFATAEVLYSSASSWSSDSPNLSVFNPATRIFFMVGFTPFIRALGFTSYVLLVIFQLRV